WALVDTFNGLMVIPNLLGLLALSGVVSVLFKEYNDLNKK
ncbi:alanine:cation symporter family protein, partial [uncultured Brachyspira sp.]